jgi:type IV secretion system protein VirB10
MNDKSSPSHRGEDPPEPTGIVSVNSRGEKATGLGLKVAFVLFVLGLLVVGSLMGYNKYAAAQAEARKGHAESEDSRTPPTAPRRIFNTDPPMPIAANTPEEPVSVPGICPGGEIARPLIGPDGKPLPLPNGQPMHVCANGQVILPGVESIPPPPQVMAMPTSASPPTAATSSAPPPSRYGGDIRLPQRSDQQGGDGAGVPLLATTQPIVDQSGHGQYLHDSQASGPGGMGRPKSLNTNDHGPIADRLQAKTPMRATASMIGDRDMILPQGRSIDCNLTVRLINEVSGKATCVLSSNAYSDNGRVILAERGSIVTGEYVAQMAQGQRRLFVLWTRLQTPKGVVISIDSPAADALGTTGLPGYVENRWRERIGAAVLLSLVEDAIGYQTAKAGAESGTQGIAVFKNSTETGRTLAERILDSTINIKPTLYKNQGDRATIFVSRDLDFGSVYALRTK